MTSAVKFPEIEKHISVHFKYITYVFSTFLLVSKMLNWKQRSTTNLIKLRSQCELQTVTTSGRNNSELPY